MDAEKRAERLVARYADMVARVGWTWLGNPYDAQDVCQNVFLKLIEREGAFESEEREKAWVLRVAINECKTLKRSAWFRRTVGLEEGEAVSVELPDDTGLFAQVGRLPPKYRRVVYLHYYEGYQVKEIAALLGLAPALVSTHLARARDKLRHMIGGELDEDPV